MAEYKVENMPWEVPTAESPRGPDLLARAGRRAEDVLLSAEQGASARWADEITSAAESVISRRPYSEVHAEKKRRLAEIPLTTSLPAEAAGAIGTTLASPHLAGGRIASSALARSYAKLPKWLKATTLGTLWGAASGAGGADEGIKERTIAAGAGGAWGFGSSAALSGAGALAKAVHGWAPAWSMYKAGRAPKPMAHKAFGQALEADVKAPGQAVAKLEKLGSKAMLMDVGGENVVGLARGLAAIPGPTMEGIKSALKTRVAGEAERVTDAVRKNLALGDYFDNEDALLAKLKDIGSTAYQEAYQGYPSIMTPKLAEILGDEIAQGALADAALIASQERLAGETKWLGEVDRELTEAARFATEVGLMGRADLRPGISRGFSLETWDYIKQGYDTLLDRPAYKNEKTGKLNKKGYAINLVRKRLVAELDKITGGDKGLYATARAKYGDTAERLKALREGAKFMGKHPDVITRELNELSEGSKTAYRNAAARAILDIVDNVPDKGSVAQRLFNKSVNRKRIATLFPERGGFNEFARTLLAEQRFTDVSSEVLHGSRTTPMAEEVSALKRMAGSVGAILFAKGTSGASLVAAGVGRNLASRLVGEPTKFNRELARLLASRDRTEQLEALELIAPFVRPDSELSKLMQGMVVGTAQTGTRIMTDNEPQRLPWEGS